MKKYITVILAFTLIVVAAFTTGTMAVIQERNIQLEQEAAALRDHNERLIRILDTNAVKHEEALTLAFNGEADKEQVVAAMGEVAEWLWMAETALEELDRVVREQDPEADIPIIIRDIQEVINQAKSVLEQAQDERKNG